MRGDMSDLRHDLQLVLTSWMRSEDTRASIDQTLTSVDILAQTMSRLDERQVQLVDALETVAASQHELVARLDTASRRQAELVEAVVHLAAIVAQVAPEALGATAVPSILGGVMEPAIDLPGIEADELAQRHDLEIEAAEVTVGADVGSHAAVSDLAKISGNQSGASDD